MLRNATFHPSTDWIYKEMCREIPNISLGTVHRNLNMLRTEVAIIKLSFAGAPNRYDDDYQPHYSRCIKCNRISDVDKPVNYALGEKVAGNTGLKILSHQLEFYRFCPPNSYSD